MINTLNQAYQPLDSLPLFQRRLHSASPKAFVFPDQVFSNTPPYPQLRQQPVLLSEINVTQAQSCSSPLPWHEVTENKRTLFLLRRLGDNLRSVHKRKVLWPTDESYLSYVESTDYLKMLLEPIADLSNQLKPSSGMKTPIQIVSLDLGLGAAVCAATFHADNFDTDFDADLNMCSAPLIAPIVISLPGKIVDGSGTLPYEVQHILSECLNYSPKVPYIIMTNYQDIVVFFPRNKLQPTYLFEQISTTQPILALRATTTACLQQMLPRSLCIAFAHPILEVDESMILPMGPPQDPSQPLLTDDHIFSTCQRSSDFDLVTVFRDNKRALQFLRWRAHVQQKFKKLGCQPGDTLIGSTNENGVAISSNRPTFPFDHSDIPDDTVQHLAAVQRPSPLVAAGLDNSLKKSTSFSLKIQDIISKGSRWGICTVYRCQIISIDNAVVPEDKSPSLCLKLFDDRFQVPRGEESDSGSEDRGKEEQERLDPRWFDSEVITERYAANEAYAFEKLQPVQGSVVPWFYGTHKFTFPDGMVLYGILMEYIEGEHLWQNHAAPLNPDRQINLIKSCRHATRVLDIADIRQWDWHGGQIIHRMDPKTNFDHAILIDFADTTQTWDIDHPAPISNYFHVLRILLNDKSAVESGLVWEHFGELDVWDTIYAPLPGGEYLHPVSLFPYIEGCRLEFKFE